MEVFGAAQVGIWRGTHVLVLSMHVYVYIYKYKLQTCRCMYAISFRHILHRYHVLHIEHPKKI